MARHRKSLCAPSVGWLLAIIAIAALPVAAEDPPEETQGEQATQQATGQESSSEPVLKSKPSTSSGNSLAAAASRIKLQKPAGEAGSGLVISNDNLKRAGSGGVMSVGSGATQAPAAQPSAASPEQGAAAGADNPANALVAQYHQQKQNVDLLTERLENYDKQLAQPNRDAHYADYHSSPHNRAPGVQDVNQLQRDALAKELEQEKKKLDALKKQAADEGIVLQ
jgi:hypothetical protein